MVKLYAKTLAGCLNLCLATVLIASPSSSFSQGLSITTGSNLVVNGNANLVINDGGLNNAGNFVAGTGTVAFTGTALPAISTIGGTGSLSFYNLSFNKTGGSAKLSKNIAVANTLLMQQGNLDLSTFDLNLGSTGNISGESASSAITGASGGSVLRTVTLNAPSAFSPGNMGIEITSAANLGLTTIKRGNQQQINSSGYSINRYFEIIPANNTALNATIKFSYFDAELASINESQLKLWSSYNNGSSWNYLGADAQDITANYVLKNGVAQMGRFTLASNVTNPLPVHFLSFNGHIANNNVQLSWITGYEVNNHHFEVEKSIDGRSFVAVTKVASSLNNAGSSYQATDYNAFINSASAYYRIKQVNNDGTHSYTKVIAFSNKSFDNKLVSIYPNPATGPVNVRFTSSAVKTVVLQVVDSKGKAVHSKQIAAQVGLNEMQYNMGHLPQGVYIVRLLGIEEGGTSIIKN